MVTVGTSPAFGGACLAAMEGPGGENLPQNKEKVLAKLIFIVLVFYTRPREKMGSCWPLEENVSA